MSGEAPTPATTPTADAVKAAIPLPASVSAKVIGQVQSATGTPVSPSVLAEVNKAVKAEINRIEAHLSVMLSDLEGHAETELFKAKSFYEADVAVIKSEFSFLEANWGKVMFAAFVFFGIGFALGTTI